MTTDIYLIAPGDAEAGALIETTRRLAAAQELAALLLPRGTRGENAYKSFAKAVIPAVQEAGAAVLVEGDPGLVRALGADGLHVTGGVATVREALAALKPDFIVGAGNVHSRENAMQIGEAGVDYILFGPLGGPLSGSDRELAAWWAEVMEIPAVLSDPEATPDRYDPAGCEFIGLSAANLLETAR